MKDIKVSYSIRYNDDNIIEMLIDIIEKGYLLGEKVIRFTKVVVSN